MVHYGGTDPDTGEPIWILDERSPTQADPSRRESVMERAIREKRNQPKGPLALIGAILCPPGIFVMIMGVTGVSSLPSFLARVPGPIWVLVGLVMFLVGAGLLQLSTNT